ncbi:GDP-D-glucose phosphorylase 1 [Aplochiton taeniatus]
MERGLFRYHLGDLKTKILPGSQGYVAQLNIERGTERRKPQEILSIKQPFDGKQFNFNKINPKEIICIMIKNYEIVKQGSKNGHVYKPCRMTVLVNVSPLEFGHCLFVPEPTLCFPQVLTRSAVLIAIESVLLSSDQGFRMGFNSLGAFASVNHLHLHGYYMSKPLQIEEAPVRPLVPDKGFYRLKSFPVGFMFYTEPEELDKVVRAICQSTDFLVEENKAHNLFFTRGCPPGVTLDDDRRSIRGGVRIIVWPRKSCFGAKEESAFNVALCELAGHLPFKNKQDYENITEKDVMDIIQKYLLPDDEFLVLEQQLVSLLQSDS